MEEARRRVNDSSWGMERQRIVILVYCFPSNVLREEHRSAADRVANHKLCFAVLTLFASAFSFKVAFPALTVLCTQVRKSSTTCADTNALARGSWVAWLSPHENKGRTVVRHLICF